MNIWRGGIRTVIRLCLLLICSFWLGMTFQRFSSSPDPSSRTGWNTSNLDLSVIREASSSGVRFYNGTAAYSMQSQTGAGKTGLVTERLKTVSESATSLDNITGVHDGGKDGMKECFWMAERGWRPHYDKHEYRYIINPDYACNLWENSKENVTILILINSGLGNTERRDAQRKTWIARSQELQLPVRILYVLAATSDKTIMDKIQYESDRHQDIIQEDFVDSYHNNTLKTIMAFKWASTFCSNVDFVMKIDDDTVLNVENLVRDLAKAPPESRRSYIAGSQCVKYKPFRQKENVYCMPVSVYPADTYPTFPQGSGYVLSIDMAGKLFKASQETLLFAYDDVFVGMLLKIIGVEIKQRSSFYYSFHFVSRAKYVRTETSLLALQKGYITWDVSPETIQYVWEAIMNGAWTTTDRVRVKCDRNCVESAGYLP